MFEFKSVSAADVAPAVRRGFDILAKENETAVLVDDDAVARISAGCGGDVRKAMNSVENCFSPAARKTEKSILRLSSQLN